MMKKALCMRIIVFLAIIFVFSAGMVSADEGRGGKTGLSAALGSGSVNIMLPIWAGNKFVLRPSFGYINTDDAGYYALGSYVSDDYRQYTVDILFRFNLSEGEAVPYYGLHVGGIISDVDTYSYQYYDYYYSRSRSETFVDGVIGLVAGGEYFLKERFSVGVESQLNLTLYDSDTSAIRHINTATFATGTFYF